MVLLPMPIREQICPERCCVRSSSTGRPRKITTAAVEPSCRLPGPLCCRPSHFFRKAVQIKGRFAGGQRACTSDHMHGHPLRRSYVDASLLPSRLIRSIIFTKHRVTLRRAHGAALLPASLCLATLLDLRDYARLESRDSCVVKVLSMPKASSE